MKLGARISHLRTPFSCLFFATLLACVAMPALAQQNDKTKVTLSDTPLSADQLAIYHAILNGWMDDGKSAVHLAFQTIPIGESAPDGDAACGKHLSMEPIVPGLVHQFRKENLTALGSDKIELVDPDKQSQEVAKNDPGKRIREGQSIGDAVANGFAHGLVSLGEIHFDKSHSHAVVWFGFTCGSLCGNGGTVLMKKEKDGWKTESRCSVWMSSLVQQQELRLGL